MDIAFYNEFNQIPIKSLADNYFIMKKLGQGTYGDVYLGYVKASHKGKKDKVAIKYYRDINHIFASKSFVDFLANGLNPENQGQIENLTKLLQQITREYKSLEKFKNKCYPNILCYRDFFRNEGDNSIYLVTEYISGLELDDYIKYLENMEYKYEIIFNLALVLIQTLANLHAEDLVHGDIKPPNIIVRSKTLQPVIIDFGLVCFVAEQKTCPRSGTRVFMAPEVFELNQVYPKSDLFSLGMSFYVSLYGQPKGSLSFENGKIRRANVDLKFQTPFPPLNALLDQLLIFDMNLRPTAAEILASFSF